LIKKSNIGILCLLETNVSGNKARNIINKFSLDMSYVVEAQGQAGGIWCAWDSSKWSFRAMDESNQIFHLNV